VTEESPIDLLVIPMTKPLPHVSRNLGDSWSDLKILRELG